MTRRRRRCAAFITPATAVCFTFFSPHHSLIQLRGAHAEPGQAGFRLVIIIWEQCSTGGCAGGLGESLCNSTRTACDFEAATTHARCDRPLPWQPKSHGGARPPACQSGGRVWWRPQLLMVEAYRSGDRRWWSECVGTGTSQKDGGLTTWLAV